MSLGNIFGQEVAISGLSIAIIDGDPCKVLTGK
jgi:hypothetical protein